MKTPSDTTGPLEIAHDLKCRNCDYNLIGLVAGDPCPECATEIVVHAPSRQIERFEASPLLPPIPKWIFIAVGVFIAAPYFVFVKGMSAPEILLAVLMPIVVLIAITTAITKMYHRTAVVFDWKDETVTFERCYRSNSYRLSLVRKKLHTCPFSDILGAETMNRQFRVYTAHGLAIIPNCMKRLDDIQHRFREIARTTDDVPTYRTASMFVFATIAVMFTIFGSILAYFFWIDPV